MAPGPIRSLRFIHNALAAQAHLVHRSCQQLQTPGEAVQVAGTIAMLVDAARGHAKGEAGGYCPTHEERAPKSTESFSGDHVAEEKPFPELLRRAGTSSSSDDLEALKDTAKAVCDNLLDHQEREETILWPLTEELFSPPEQGAIVGAILAHVPKEDLPMLIPWMVQM